MSREPRAERTTRSSMALRSGLAMSDLDLDQLWAGYLGLGGALDQQELRDALDGRRTITDHEHDTIAQALNDHFVVKGQNHPVAYSDDLTETQSDGSDPT